MNPPDDLRVLIVAQNPLARIGLSALLARQPGLSVVGEMSGEADLITEIAVHHPDVLVWDLDWAAALDQLTALNQPAPPVVALVPDESYTADAWAAGARGVLSHNANAETLAAALAAVSLGMAVFDPAFAVAKCCNFWLKARPTRSLPPGWASANTRSNSTSTPS
jgi:DNA-binding NarL/FixJ family response regulator